MRCCLSTLVLGIARIYKETREEPLQVTFTKFLRSMETNYMVIKSSGISNPGLAVAHRLEKTVRLPSAQGPWFQVPCKDRIRASLGFPNFKRAISVKDASTPRG